MARKQKYSIAISLMLGLVLVWLVFRNTNTQDLTAQLQSFTPGWIMLSLFINLVSQWLRAHRWKQLFKPLRYQPRLINLFLATLVLAFTNQLIPRGGEFSRLAVIQRTERIQFTKLLGIALAERLTDLVVLITLFAILVLWQFQQFIHIINLPAISYNGIETWPAVLVLSGLCAIIIAAWLLRKKISWIKRLHIRAKKFLAGLSDGFSALKKVKNLPLYIFESLAIYALWLLMLYVLFLAYPPTSQLHLKTAAFTYGIATMAFLLPVQSGMGAWHFLVIQCLGLFGIASQQAKAFAIVAHASTNLVFIVFGLIALSLIPVFNSKPYAKQSMHLSVFTKPTKQGKQRIKSC